MSATLLPAAYATAQHESQNRKLIRMLPWLPIICYLGLTFGLFLLWPINWPIYQAWNWLRLILYVGAVFALITWGYMLGTGGMIRRGQALPRAELFIAAGGLATILLLFPSAYIYTGRWPWQVLEALGDQGDAYRSFQQQLLETAGQRGPIALVRALAAPLTFAVLPLGVVYWSRLTWVTRFLVLGAVASTLILSILRGTDREVSDLFIITSSAMMVLIGRQADAGTRVIALAKRYGKHVVVALVLVAIAFSMFTERKAARLGGYEQRQMVCANDSQICADIDTPALKLLPLSTRFGLSMFIMSTCSGYYGLELAMEKDFRPTWGVGHSPAALTVYELLSGDEQLEGRTYTFRNAYDGWNPENYWSTLITWIANDVGFPGALVVMLLLGALWGRMWRDATWGQSDPAVVLFCLIMTMVYYLPANNQVFAAYDGYTVFFGWLALWLTLGRGERTRAAAR